VTSDMILIRVLAIGMLIAATMGPLQAVESQAAITFAENRLGEPPADFDFGASGSGQAGKWTVVRDPTASQGLALEQASGDATDDRFEFAIYRSLSLKNLIVSTRFKLIAGTTRSAGLVFRFRDANNYYILRADAVEGRVDIFCVTNSEVERISGTDADVVLNHWQTLKLAANGDQFEVSLDDIPLFTAWDRTFLTDGSIGLWTEGDNVTRFDQFNIAALPWSAGP
jgi:hypothetical protein